MICSMLCSLRLCTQITLTNLSVYWLFCVQCFSTWAEGSLAGCATFPSYTTPADVILREFSFVFGDKITWRTWEGLEVTLGGEYCCKVQMQREEYSIISVYLCRGSMIFLYLHHPEFTAKAGPMLCSSAIVQMKKVLFHPISKVSVGWQHDLWRWATGNTNSKAWNWLTMVLTCWELTQWSGAHGDVYILQPEKWKLLPSSTEYCPERHHSKKEVLDQKIQNIF